MKPSKPTPKRAANKRKGFVRDAQDWVDIEAGRDYTPEILAFLQEAHGKIRVDSHGDYYYEGVSALSLHFLLRSRLPGRELLWQWYQHFEVERAEDIYQTLPPQRDEEFLEILSRCRFDWNPEAVRESGLVFLPEHRTEFYLGLDEWLSMRLEEYETMSDEELREVLQPSNTWTDMLMKKLVKKIQTDPLDGQERERIYQQFESDYLRATVRHLLDEATHESFWKSPPPELEPFHGRVIIFARTMANTARRLGVYVTRKEHESNAFAGNGGFGHNGHRAHWGSKTSRAGLGGNGPQGRNGRRNGVSNGMNNGMAREHFDALGLTPTATLEEVRVAYREQVKQHHPDQGGSVQDFLRLQEAYEYLLTQVF